MTDGIFFFRPCEAHTLTARIDCDKDVGTVLRSVSTPRIMQYNYPELCYAVLALAAGRKPHTSQFADYLTGMTFTVWQQSLEAAVSSAVFGFNNHAGAQQILLMGEIYKYLCPLLFYQKVPDYDEYDETLRPHIQPIHFIGSAANGSVQSPTITFAYFANIPTTVVASEEKVYASRVFMDEYESLNPGQQVTRPRFVGGTAALKAP